MNTSVIGYPRIGKDRELKFASEKYFRGEISEEELLSVAKEIRKKGSHTSLPTISPSMTTCSTRHFFSTSFLRDIRI